MIKEKAKACLRKLDFDLFPSHNGQIELSIDVLTFDGKEIEWELIIIADYPEEIFDAIQDNVVEDTPEEWWDNLQSFRGVSNIASALLDGRLKGFMTFEFKSSKGNDFVFIGTESELDDVFIMPY